MFRHRMEVRTRPKLKSRGCCCLFFFTDVKPLILYGFDWSCRHFLPPLKEWFLKISKWMMATLALFICVWLPVISNCPPSSLHPPTTTPPATTLTPPRICCSTALWMHLICIDKWMDGVCYWRFRFFFSSCRHILMNSGQREERKSEAKLNLFF